MQEENPAINTTATAKIIDLMKSAAIGDGTEIYIPVVIASRSGAVSSESSILVRINNLKPMFKGWSFYTRTCMQTGRKILGAKKDA